MEIEEEMEDQPIADSQDPGPCKLQRKNLSTSSVKTPCDGSSTDMDLDGNFI